MRLIDADAIPYTMLYKENWMSCTGIEKRGVWKDTIDAMPTIEERKMGKWIKGIGESGVTTSLFCSLCGQENPHWYDWNYCPNCGARMKGEKK